MLGVCRAAELAVLGPMPDAEESGLDTFGTSFELFWKLCNKNGIGLQMNRSLCSVSLTLISCLTW